MRKSRLLVLLALIVGSAFGAQREESVLIFEQRKVSIKVPAGFSYEAKQDAEGLTQIQLAAPDDKVTVHLTLLPDEQDLVASARARRERMVAVFFDYVGDSTEKAMQFEELKPRSGAGTFCVFTDTKLVGKKALPPGEYLHLTAGLKAWANVVVVFRVFSNDTTSAEYRAAMKLLRESVEEKPVPLK